MQSRTQSLIEQLLNVSSGFILSLIVWVYVISPVWDIELSGQDNLLITCVFTVMSILRGYIWRRLFNSYFTNKGTK